MIDDLKQKQIKLIEEIQEDIFKGLDVTICHQHRRILYHMQGLVTGLAEAEANGRNIFDVLRRNWGDFYDALLKAQAMAERMEKGLQERNKFMFENGSEYEYQEKKEKKK